LKEKRKVIILVVILAVFLIGLSVFLIGRKIYRANLIKNATIIVDLKSDLKASFDSGVELK